MSYAADGPLEPNWPEEVQETFLPDVLGYRVLATEWSDDTYTLNIYRIDEWKSEDVIQDGEVTWDWLPDTDKIREIIEETLEERADRSMT
jgi:hypothetical protein